jgi:hypothetical protein
MGNCSSCGSSIPDGQGSSCSICYGDISHGTYGYYEEWARQQDKQAEQEGWEQDQDYPPNQLNDNGLPF